LGIGKIAVKIKKLAKILDIRSAPVMLRIFTTRKKLHRFGEKYVQLRREFLAKEIQNWELILVPEMKIGRLILNWEKKIMEVPLGANFKLFKPGKEYELRVKHNLVDKEVLIYSGAIYPQRKLDTILKSLECLIYLEKNKDICLLVVGDGPDRRRLEKMAKNLGISDKVIFTGFKNYREVPRYLRVADIGISFVPKNETFEYQPPLKTIEYMASGLPTIATSTYGNQRFIIHKKNGVLSDDTAESISFWISTLINDSNLKRKIKKMSRKSVLKYDWFNITKRRLIPAYENALLCNH